MTPPLLSRDEAVDFLRERLHIYDDVTHVSLDLLERIIVAFHQNLPFQSLTNMAVPPQDRHVPSSEQVKQDMLLGLGGLCTSQNYFVYELLHALGFNTSLAAGIVREAPDINHALVIVRDLVLNGDVYLADVGTGYPTFHAVPLDFSQESPVYHDSFQTYKYVRLDTSTGGGSSVTRYARMIARRVDKVIAPVVDDTDEMVWTQFYQFTLDNIDYTELAQRANKTVYENMSSRLNLLILVCGWPNPHGRAVVIENKTLYQEDDTGQLNRMQIATNDELEELILKYYPAFDKDTVHKAVSIWSTLPPCVDLKFS